MGATTTGGTGLDRVLRTAAHARVPRPAAIVRIVAGAAFVWFGVPKFTDNAGWVTGFGSWGLPESALLVYATGLAEVLGGLVLIAGLRVLVRPTALVLILVMAGATFFGGIIGGAPISLFVPPLLLAATGFVLWSTTPAGRRPAVAAGDERDPAS